jgi:hypothetical protein
MGHITFLSMYMLCRHQNAGQIQNKKRANKSFENVTSKLKYLETKVTDQNLIHEEINRRLNPGNASHRSVPKLLSSHLHSKNIKFKMYKTIILPVILYERETWCVTLRDEHKLRVFENSVLRNIFRLKRDEATGGWRKLHNE